MNFLKRSYSFLKRIRLDKPRIARVVAPVLTSRIFVVPLSCLIMLAFLPWMIGALLWYHSRQRLLYGCKGFKRTVDPGEPLRVVTLVVGEADPQKALERIGRTRRAHSRLRSTRSWPKACLPKLRVTIIQLQNEGAKIEVNDDTLSAYFYGENTGDEYLRVKKAFEDLRDNPHFLNTRIGEAEALQESYYSNQDVAMRALEDALRPTP